MLRANPLTWLLVNEQADEIKLTTISLRRFFPGCRVEAVYSAEEALEWAEKQAWHVILLDERIPCQSGLTILPELRRLAPHATIILQASRADSDLAAQATRDGADSYLFKHSPAFLVELPLVAQTAWEKRELSVKLDRAERYLHLLEDITEMVYELDAEGCFVHASPHLLSRLGYSEPELMGVHSSKLIHPDDQHAVVYQFNERRTGARASRKVSLRLLRKQRPANEEASLDVEIHATGLYSQQRRFLGTLGIARETTIRMHEHARLLQIEQRLQALQAQAAQAAQAANELVSVMQPSGPRSVAGTVGGTDAAPPVEQIPVLSQSSYRQASPESPTPTSPIVAHQDRRRSPRINRSIEARLSLNGSSWEGTVLDISLNGLYMVFNNTVSATVGQPIQLGITSQVGVLEIHGTVRGTREAVGPLIALPDRPALGLAVEFSQFGTTEELILASLLEELREGPASVTVTALLTPQETGDLLLEICSTDTEATKAEPVHPSPSLSGLDASPTSERRLAIRVNLSIPAQIESADGSARFSKQVTFTTNLSLGGACLHLLTATNPIGQRFLLHLTPPQERENQTSSAPMEAQPTTVNGEVIWAAPESTAPSDLRERPASIPLRVGVRFFHQNHESERWIAELAGRHLIIPAAVEEGAESGKLKSELFECRNNRGQRIAVYHDQPQKALPPGSPLIIISPGYGETKKEYVTLAYYLASNGFHVLRYDHTNHVGESEGDIRDSTLSSMKQDLAAILDYATLTWPGSPVVMVATSLASRVALKVASQDRRITLLVLLTGVVDVQATLLAVHQEDYIGTYAQGTRRGVVNMLGFNIAADRWLDDAIKEGYADLRTTIRDAEQTQTSVILFTAEQDAWVRMEAIKEVRAALRQHAVHWYLIPEALHRLHENPRKARAVFRHLVACCLEHLYPLSPRGNVAEPSQREIGLQSRLERERARAQHQMAKADNVQFWQDYLANFHYIVNSSDYWHLLDHIYSLAGTFEKGRRVLDAGCGNGNFSMFLLINQAYRQRSNLRGRVTASHYVGVDFVHSALLQARVNLANVTDELRQKLVATVMTQTHVQVSLSLADLNMPLPFHDSQFERIICNLVIGYLHDPLFTLRELLRVLSPSGKLVLTNLKPHSDLSQIYRNFACLADRPEELEEARQVLNNSGKIKQGESDGIFRFFNRQELAMLLISSGAPQPRIYSTFANQAYIAVVEKPGTTYAAT